MRILQTFDKQQHNVNHRKKRKDEINDNDKETVKDGYKVRTRPDFSEKEIRDRILKHRQRKIRSEAMAQKQKGSNEFQTEEILSSDLGVNDPNNPVTIEKLRSLLETGAFRFSEKERQVLANILSER